MEINDYRIQIVKACITGQGLIEKAIEKMNSEKNKDSGRFIYNHANYLIRSCLYNQWVFLSKDLANEGKEVHDLFFVNNFEDEDIVKYQAFIDGMSAFIKEYKNLFEDCEQKHAKKAE